MFFFAIIKSMLYLDMLDVSCCRHTQLAMTENDRYLRGIYP